MALTMAYRQALWCHVTLREVSALCGHYLYACCFRKSVLLLPDNHYALSTGSKVNVSSSNFVSVAVPNIFANG